MRPPPRPAPSAERRAGRGAPVPERRSSRACPRGHVLSALLLGACLFAPVPGRAAPAADPAARKQAAAAVEAAARAYEAGEFAAALAEFERAMALRPSPKLHYNIAACHHQLMFAARQRGEAAAQREHADAASAAYRAYLRDNPGADDRGEVELLLLEVGGTATPQLKPIPPPRPGDASPPVAAPPAPTGSPPPAVVDVRPPSDAAPPGPEATPPGPEPPVAARPGHVSAKRPLRGRVGASFGLLGQPQVPTDRLDGAVQALWTVRAGGFLGARRRLYLGGAVTLTAPGETAKTRLALLSQLLLIDLEYAVPLGRNGRVELPLGLFVAAAREALRVRGGQPLPACAVQSAGTLVSARAGGGAGGRVGLLVLVGARQNHEIGVRLSTAILGFGTGSAAAGCDERPFAAYAVPRARWQVGADVGYAFRF